MSQSPPYESTCCGYCRGFSQCLTCGAKENSNCPYSCYQSNNLHLSLSLQVVTLEGIPELETGRSQLSTHLFLTLETSPYVRAIKHTAPKILSVHNPQLVTRVFSESFRLAEATLDDGLLPAGCCNPLPRVPSPRSYFTSRVWEHMCDCALSSQDPPTVTTRCAIELPGFNSPHNGLDVVSRRLGCSVQELPRRCLRSSKLHGAALLRLPLSLAQSTVRSRAASRHNPHGTLSERITNLAVFHSPLSVSATEFCATVRSRRYLLGCNSNSHGVCSWFYDGVRSATWMQSSERMLRDFLQNVFNLSVRDACKWLCDSI